MNDEAYRAALLHVLLPFKPKNPAKPNGYDPAPPWAADVAAAVFEACNYPIEGGVRTCLATREASDALHWCSLGEPVSRASMVLAFCALLHGSAHRDRWPLFRDWLRSLYLSKAGRRAGAPRRVFRAPTTHLTWEERDAQTKKDAIWAPDGKPV